MKLTKQMICATRQALLVAMEPFERAMARLLEQRWPGCSAEALVEARPARKMDVPVPLRVRLCCLLLL